MGRQDADARVVEVNSRGANLGTQKSSLQRTKGNRCVLEVDDHVLVVTEFIWAEKAEEPRLCQLSEIS